MVDAGSGYDDALASCVDCVAAEPTVNSVGTGTGHDQVVVAIAAEHGRSDSVRIGVDNIVPTERKNAPAGPPLPILVISLSQPHDGKTCWAARLWIRLTILRRRQGLVRGCNVIPR